MLAGLITIQVENMVSFRSKKPFKKNGNTNQYK